MDDVYFAPVSVPREYSSSHCESLMKFFSFFYGPGAKDIVESLKRNHIALYLAWSDTRARYRRSVLGPFWLTLGTAIGVAGLGLLWSVLLKVDRQTFVPSLTAGLIVWQLISSCLIESSTVFARQANIIRNLRLPYFLHPMQLVMRHAINFFHNLVVFAVVAIFFSVPLSWGTLLFIPGLVIVMLNLLWISLFIGMLGARFRDVEHALAALVPLLFFVSPVIYRPDYLPFKSSIVWLNPITHFIEVVRDPLLGSIPPGFVYFTNFAILCCGWLVTLLLFNTRRNRIAFWV